MQNVWKHYEYLFFLMYFCIFVYVFSHGYLQFHFQTFFQKEDAPQNVKLSIHASLLHLLLYIQYPKNSKYTLESDLHLYSSQF